MRSCTSWLQRWVAGADMRTMSARALKGTSITPAMSGSCRNMIVRAVGTIRAAWVTYITDGPSSMRTASMSATERDMTSPVRMCARSRGVRRTMWSIRSSR